MRKISLVVGGLLLVNVVFLALTANPHLGHVVQLGVALCLIFYGVVYEKVSRGLHWIVRLLCLVPVGVMLFLVIYGNQRGVDFEEGVLIVLGAGLHGEEVTPHLASRLDTTVEYFNRNPDVFIILCGGLGARQLITEAEAMERYLVERGVPLEQIIREEQSTSTYENLVFAQEILEEYFPGEVRVALITNDFHIYRAVRLADGLGLSVNPMGAPTPWVSWPLNYLREMLAVMRMWIF